MSTSCYAELIIKLIIKIKYIYILLAEVPLRFYNEKLLF